MNPRELLRKLDALRPYPAEAVVEAVHRLEADPSDALADVDAFAASEARRLFATVTAMRAAGG